MSETFCGLSANRFGVDDAFAVFFRLHNDLADEVATLVEELERDAKASVTDVIRCLPLDRLSLLACLRQGLQPTELLQQGQGSVASARSPASLSSSRASRSSLRHIEEATEMRRLGKIRIAEQERKAIVAVLLSVQPNSKTLTKEQNALLVQLREQEKRALALLPDPLSTDSDHDDLSVGPQCNDPAESDACDVLMSRQTESDVHEKALKKRLHKAEVAARQELEKVKTIQRRLMVSDLTNELMRQAVSEHLDRKKAALSFHLEELKRERAEKAESTNRERALKTQQCQQQFRSKLRSRRQEIEHRAEYRNDRSRRAQLERQQLIAQRRSSKEREAEVAHHRLTTMEAQQEAYRKLLDEESDAKMKMHAANAERIKLHQQASVEVKRVHAAEKSQRVVAVSRAAESEHSVIEKSVEEKSRDAERRAAAVKAAHIERSKIVGETERARHEAAEKARQELLQAQAAHCAEVAAYSMAKEERIAAVAAQRETERTIKADLNEQRLVHHEENLRRVVLAQEYQHSIKAALVSQEDERARHLRLTQEQHKKEMAALLLSLDRQRDNLKKSLDAAKHRRPSSAATTRSESSNERLPTRDQIMQKAEEIVARNVEKSLLSAEASKSTAAGSALRAARSQSHLASSDNSSANSDVDSATESREVCGVSARLASERPQSASVKRLQPRIPSRQMNSGSLSKTAVTLETHTLSKLALSPQVVHQLAQIEELDDFELREVERRVAGSAPPTRKGNAATPLQEMVERMNAFYGAAM